MKLETSRLIIRPYCPEDLTQLHQIFSDEEVMRFSQKPCTLEETRALLTLFLEKKIAWAVERKDTGLLIGHLLFSQLPREEPGIYEIGWFFRRDHWHRGYALESCQALMAYGFQTLHLHKIMAETIDPAASGALARKLGMALEGSFHAHTKAPDGVWADVYWYGICNPQEEII